jgi:hypothetical protein
MYTILKSQIEKRIIGSGCIRNPPVQSRHTNPPNALMLVECGSVPDCRAADRCASIIGEIMKFAKCGTDACDTVDACSLVDKMKVRSSCAI